MTTNTFGPAVVGSTVDAVVNGPRHVAQAARSRGHRLVLNTRPARPVLSLALDAAELTVTIDEVDAQVPHVLTVDERRRKKREPWIRLPEHDRMPTGRLTLSVGRSWHGNPHSWADDGKTTVKSRIEEILTQVEEGVVEDRRRRAEAEREHREHMEAPHILFDVAAGEQHVAEPGASALDA
jgi:hypothetical protein